MPYPRDKGLGWGRHTILIDEWGPYDWRSPRLWPHDPADSAYRGGPVSMAVLGPRGQWRLHRIAGASIRPERGGVGDTVVITPRGGPGALVDWLVELEYVGARVESPDGHVTPAGRPFRFAAQRVAVPTRWRVRAFTWDSTADPRRDSIAFAARLEGQPLLERTDQALDYLWSRPRLPGFPQDRFAVVAESEVDLPGETFELLAISDDAIRIWVDDRLVIDRWAPHESAVDTASLPAGRHRIRVHYYQVDGWVELRVEVGRPSVAAARAGN